jgi:carbamate kinase
METIVIALGGNALLNPSGKQSFSTESNNMDRIAKDIALLSKKYNIVITHGNGSQVGDELMRNEHAKKFVPQLPLYLLNAETQAQIGSVIETSLRNSLAKLKIKKDVCVVLSHVVVESNDAAFKSPTKQVGPFYTKSELQAELKLDKFDYIKVGNSYRRVVASPKPKGIVELNSIKLLCKTGIVVTCGGGGIPTVKGKGLRKLNAVIDKDLTTQLLANLLGVDVMLILTNADYVYSDYKSKKNPIKSTSAKLLKTRIGSFEQGTMKPKIEACINFVENGGKAAYIGNIFKIHDILNESTGTKIYR